MVLGGDPEGLATLPMGCLDHDEYSMSNKDDFYKNFILELVTNNIDYAGFKLSDLPQSKSKQPRIGTRVFCPESNLFEAILVSIQPYPPKLEYGDAIQAPDCMNVMYTLGSNGRGKVSRMEKVFVPEGDYYHREARQGLHRNALSRFIYFPLPKSPQRYLWIDLSWPIRSILLPISQVSCTDAKPYCTYAQIDFRRLEGKLADSGWAEDGNQKFSSWRSASDRGFVINDGLATMRVDVELLYKQLTLPRSLRKDDFNILAPLQVHRWDTVAYDPTLPMNTNRTTESGTVVSNYPISDESLSRPSSEGIGLEDIRGAIYSKFPAPPPKVMGNIMNTVVSLGLGLIPVIGPLLAFNNDLVFKVLQDPNNVEIKNQLTAEFGADLTKKIIECAVGYHGLVKGR